MRRTAFRTMARVPPDDLDAYLTWKTAEGSVLQDQPGFCGTLVFRDREDQERLTYVSQWTSMADTANLQEDPRYVQVAAEHGIPLFPAAVRDGEQSPEEVGYRSAFDIRDRVVADVVVAEGNKAGRLPPVNALVFSYQARLAPGSAPAFEEFKRAEAEGQLSAPGFYYRLLLRHARADDEYTYLSVWDDRETANTFHETFVASEVYQHRYEAIGGFADGPDYRDGGLLLSTVSMDDRESTAPTNGPPT